MNRLGSRRVQLPTLATGLLIGALLSGGLVPLLGTDVVTSSAGTPGIFGAEAGPAGSVPVGGASSGALTDATGSTSGGSGGVAAGSTSGGEAPASLGGAPGSATEPGSGAPVELTASDVGVTPEVIRIGALTLNCGGCAAFGLSLTPTSHAEIVQTFVEDLNARGGILGRRVELHTRDFDPVADGVSGGGTQRAGCIELTERRQVFAVVHGGTFSNACIYGEHSTPLITTTEPSAADPDAFNQSSGRLWTLAPSSARTLTNWARQLVAQGILTPTTRYGIVVQEYDGQNVLVDRYLIAELERLGVPPTHVALMPGNVATFPTAAAAEEAAMRTRGIDHVLLALDQAVNSGLFIQQAERNGWRPRYLVSEFPSGANDFTGGSQPSSFEGAIGIAHTPAWGITQARQDPAVRRCLDVWERHTGAPTLESDVAWVLSYCTSLRVFEIAATIAGPNLTRDALVQGIAAIGPIELPGYVGAQGTFGGPYGFGPVRWSAVDRTNTMTWTNACPRSDDRDGRCWVETRAGDRMDV